MSLVGNSYVPQGDPDFFYTRRSLLAIFNFYYGEMMWGLNYQDDMDQFNPLGWSFANGQKKLEYRKTRWEKALSDSVRTESGRTSWEKINRCARNTGQYPRPDMFQSNSGKSKGQRLAKIAKMSKT